MNLTEFFKEHKKAALAFSGGVDSAYLLYAGLQNGCDLHAYYLKSDFQPDFELKDALRLAKELRAELTVIETDVFSCPEIIKNPSNRCYHCKKMIFTALLAAAKKDGYDLLIDGTNASDDASSRPGMRALEELSVRSPLKECELTKDEIRTLSKDAGLFTWEKPAYACLATRIPSGTEITKEKLRLTETSESILSDLGFTDFRIRLHGNTAKIQVPESQIPKIIQYRKEILTKLERYYDSITLDLEGRP